MELRHLRYFVAVAEELHFSRAATRLHIAQPPLSRQIRDLEREVDTPLFLRTPRGVELTHAGRAFLPEARLTLAQAERAQRTAQLARGGTREASASVVIDELKPRPSRGPWWAALAAALVVSGGLAT